MYRFFLEMFKAPRTKKMTNKFKFQKITLEEMSWFSLQLIFWC